jgi:AcrR family transcriptional regulator
MSLEPPLPAPVRPRSTRDRPAKSPLSVEAVVDAALAILKTDGLGAVTMRRVAAALDTGAASLYVYVAGSDGLHRAMLDRVTTTVALETPDPSRWRDQMHSLLQRMYETFTAYPGIAALTLAYLPSTDPILLVAENLLGILLAGGIEPQNAAWTGDIFIMLVTALATEDDVRRGNNTNADEDLRQQVDELYRTFTGLPVDRFPFLTTYAAQLVAGDRSERFHFAIDVVIDGVLARSVSKPLESPTSHQH